MILKGFLSFFSTFAVTGFAIATFSHFMLELFGVSIPNLFWPMFKDIGAGFLITVAFIFAVTWFLKARPNKKPKNYSIVCFDVFGKETLCMVLELSSKIMTLHGVS